MNNLINIAIINNDKDYILQFESFLNTLINKNCKKYVILDFYKNICKPCKQFEPYFNKIYQKFKEYYNIKFLKINISQPKKMPELIEYFDITSIPTFIIAEIEEDQQEINILHHINGVDKDMKKMQSNMINFINDLKLLKKDK
jgi:thiol-disulfide isomerase/thioredoxin